MPNFVNRKENLTNPTTTMTESLWSNYSLPVQAELLVFISKDITKTMKTDFDSNINTDWKENGLYKSSLLENMNLESYLRKRDIRLVSFLLGFLDVPLQHAGDSLPMLLTIVESIYNLVTGSVMPFSFSLAIIMYKKFNSEQLSNMLGGLFACGKYGGVLNWLQSYAESHQPKIKAKVDTIFGVDNEQKHGKTYSIQLASKLVLSCICVIIAFFSPCKTLLQFAKFVVTSSWTFFEATMTPGEKDQVKKKAIYGLNEAETKIKEQVHQNEKNRIAQRFSTQLSIHSRQEIFEELEVFFLSLPNVVSDGPI